MRLFRIAGSNRAPWRKGFWVFPLWDKGALQLWGAAGSRRVRGQRWMCVTQGLPWRVGRSPRGDGQNLQEVWAELTATRNKPLRNLATWLEMDCTKEGDTFQQGWFWLHIRKKLLTVWCWTTGRCCPERGWMSHPWQHSRSGCSGLWATWSSRCPSGKVDCMTLKSSFQPVLFYDSTNSDPPKPLESG